MFNAKRSIFLIATLIALCFLWLFSLQPENDKDWQTAYENLPEISLTGDILTINNVRDFRYQANGEIDTANYQRRQYNISELTGLWFGLSHFAPLGLAHAFLSFEFKGNDFLVVSIEARLEKHHNGYNPISGLFRQYNKTIVLASEEDVIGLRTHIRKEPVYLYPIESSPIRLRALLFQYLREIDDLHVNPTFYHSFFDNCLTGLLRASKNTNHWWQWLDYRIILPGYSDRLLFAKQQLSLANDLQTWRQQHLIDPDLSSIDDKHFSTAIRNP